MQKQSSMAFQSCKEGFCAFLHYVGAEEVPHPFGGTPLPKLVRGSGPCLGFHVFRQMNQHRHALRFRPLVRPGLFKMLPIEKPTLHHSCYEIQTETGTRPRPLQSKRKCLFSIDLHRLTA